MKHRQSTPLMIYGLCSCLIRCIRTEAVSDDMSNSNTEGKSALVIRSYIKYKNELLKHKQIFLRDLLKKTSRGSLKHHIPKCYSY